VPGGAAIGHAVVHGKWGVGSGVVCLEVQDAADGGQDGACQRGATVTEADDLPPDPILLGGEGVGCEGGCIEVPLGGMKEVKACQANEELDITELEGPGVGRCRHVFARAEEEEGGAGHVGDSPTVGGVGGGGNIEGMEDDRDGDGLDTGKWRVRPCVPLEKAKNMEVDLAKLI
jgi:hypothetical protein